jgi:hypothetical protein
MSIRTCSQEEKKELAKQIEKIVKRKLTIRQISTADFADYLRTYTFDSLREKNLVLKNYCNIVLDKDLIYAIFIDLGPSPSIKSFDMQIRICRGKSKQDVFNEFSSNDDLVIPRWYRSSKVKMDDKCDSFIQKSRQ